MAKLTAVELGADMCALARTSVRRGEVQLLAAETLDPAAFPGIDAFTGAVRQARRALKLPRRCRAVVWGLPDGATRKDPTVKPLIAPLVGAGFKVERITSPCNALAALARLKMPRGEGATCWLAINRTGVAMIVVRPGKQLYSHSFAWDSNVGSSGSQARLLQRYSLVAFLAPEIRRAMSAAREKGTPIDAIVTCGNLPEIRSLTMPLIEELDVEIESLDSLDGLIVKPDATDRLSDVAASLRIACAGAIARPTRRRDESRRSTFALRSFGRVGTAAAVILGAGLVGWSWWKMPSVAPPPATSTTSAKATPKQAAAKQTSTAPKETHTLPQQTPAPAQKPDTPPVASATKQDVRPRVPTYTEPPAVSGARKPAESNPPAVSEVKKPAESKPPAPKPAPQPPPTMTKQPAPTPMKQGPATPTKQLPPAPAGTAASVSDAAKRATANTPPLTAPPQLSAAKPEGSAKAPTRTAESKSTAARPPPLSRGVLDTQPRPADKPDATPARKPAVSAPSPLPPAVMPELLKDPLPRVTAILVSSDRRMATIDEGRIISVGEVLGKRVVVAIDERAVVLKEPSGVQIRVGLGGKILGVER
jgi:hypothetical protein